MTVQQWAALLEKADPDAEVIITITAGGSDIDDVLQQLRDGHAVQAVTVGSDCQTTSAWDETVFIFEIKAEF